MKSRVSLAVLGLRISAIIYYLLMVGCLVLALVSSESPENKDSFFGWFLFIFLIPFVVFLEFVIHFLQKRRFWAWVAGLILGALYAPSLFLPLGVMILVGLLAEGSRNEFGLQKKIASTRASGPGAGNTAQAACAECHGLFSIQDLISYDGVQMCARCKPIFLQRLTEGAKHARCSAVETKDES